MRPNINPESKIGQQIGNFILIKHLGMLVIGRFLAEKSGKYTDARVRYYLCKCVKCGAEQEKRYLGIKRAKCKNCRKQKL